MLVFNLTESTVTYRGRPIPPHGGSLEFLGLTFIPDRDRALEKAGILAFGQLPKYWKPKAPAPATPQVLKVTVATVVTAKDLVTVQPMKTQEEPPAKEEAKEEVKDEPSKDQNWKKKNRY